ncbi:hypothetical protein ACE1ET_20605, partial [Saccharicrinis sp. FJH62]|uniref:hypothetical protein n=1 Tax=Saccharicrinis sp. FJH62 TaxID=3344657 RepID=UPI0035D47886
DGKAFSGGATGGVAEVADSPYLVVDPANQSHALFTGMTFTDDKIMIVGETATDDGGAGTKSLQYGTDQVISGDNTLLGYQEGAEGNVTVGVNYIPAGSTIGSETTKADAVLICQNYGSIIHNWGNNLTSEGLTLWRNAVYMLAGLEVPTELVQSSVGVNKVQSEATVTVYPSITSGTFTVEFAGEPGMITVYNLSGKVVKQVVPSSGKENISIDGSGLYII